MISCHTWTHHHVIKLSLGKKVILLPISFKGFRNIEEVSSVCKPPPLKPQMTALRLKDSWFPCLVNILECGVFVFFFIVFCFTLPSICEN